MLYRLDNISAKNENSTVKDIRNQFVATDAAFIYYKNSEIPYKFRDFQCE